MVKVRVDCRVSGDECCFSNCIIFLYVESAPEDAPIFHENIVNSLGIRMVQTLGSTYTLYTLHSLYLKKATKRTQHVEIIASQFLRKQKAIPQ